MVSTHAQMHPQNNKYAFCWISYEWELYLSKKVALNSLKVMRYLLTAVIKQNMEGDNSENLFEVHVSCQ